MASSKQRPAKHESSVITYSSDLAISARREIFARMQDYPATEEEKERSLSLFLRGSQLARLLAVTDIYRRIVELPGIIMDVGTWRGQTAVLCENLRAIYEPLHLNRRIVCFDTFEGYKGFGGKDKATALHREGSYDTGGDYAQYLRDLLRLHEQSNAMGHNFDKHSVIAGDCRKTIPDYFKKNPSELVALAFFDVNAYEPTLQSFQDIWARMVPGGIAVFWQLTRDKVPAEGRVYAENILNKIPHRIERCETYPGLCFIEKTSA